MSLVVWLPLTKDLRQQGLSNVTVTNNGATFNSAGKLGGCYSFDGTDDRIYANNVSINNSAMSACCWVKFNNLTSSDYPYIFALGSNTSGTGIQIGLAVWKSDSKIHLVGNGSEPSSGYTPPTNTWIHLCITINGATTKLYVNGVLTNTQTNANSPKTQTCLCLGARPNSTSGAGIAFSYPISGYINDFRLYDHCLSPMEVKELAKGLVLHYPLNRQGWGQENLATQYIMPGGNNPGTTSTAGRTNYYGDYGITIPATENADTYFSIWYDTPLTSGETYTLSAEVSGLLNGSYYNFPLFAQGNSAMGLFKIDHNGFVSLTFTMNYTGSITTATVNNKTYYRMFMDDISRSIASGQGAITIKNIKLEKGSKATPWCPNSADTLATTLGLNGTTEYDCSGFCNNGTLWAYDTAGAITYTSDTPKYQISTYINSDSNTTNTASGTQYIYGNCELTTPQYLTAAFWCKPIAGYGSSTGQGQFSLTKNVIGASAGEDYNACPMNHRDGYIDMCTSTNVHKTMNITFTANEWHHYAIVYDGRYGRVYKDGVATGQTLDMGAVLSLTNMKGAVIGFSKAGGVWRSNKSYYSDFRIYATALSASDVLSLYQNSAYIDSSGNVYGAVHTEV